MKFVSNAKYGEPVEAGTIYEGRAGRIDITVHRRINCSGWFLTCRRLGIENRTLKSETLMKAIREAEELIKNTLRVLLEDIAEMDNEKIEISRY